MDQVTGNHDGVQWGAEIVVDGVRPAWLGEGDKFCWRDVAGWTAYGDWTWNEIPAHYSPRAIRLPADHPYYLATARGFTYWPGGEYGPADWDGGQVLLRSGIFGSGNQWGRNTPAPIGYEGDHDIIGYRRKTETANNTWVQDAPVLTEFGQWVSDMADREAEQYAHGYPAEACRDYRKALMARIARTEQPPVDPDLVAAEKLLAEAEGWEANRDLRIALAAIRRGRQLERGES